MNEVDADTWLKNAYVGRNGVGLDQGNRAYRLSIARRIERYEGDLDAHYERDGMTKLLDRLSYPLGDWRRAQALYGGFCRLLPGDLRIRDAASPA